MPGIMPVGNKQDAQVALAGITVDYTGWDMLVHSAEPSSLLCSQLAQPPLPFLLTWLPSPLISFLLTRRPFILFLSSSASGTQGSKQIMLAKMVEIFTSAVENLLISTVSKAQPLSSGTLHNRKCFITLALLLLLLEDVLA